LQRRKTERATLRVIRAKRQGNDFGRNNKMGPERQHVRSRNEVCLAYFRGAPFPRRLPFT